MANNYLTNIKVGEEIAKERDKQHFTQTTMAEEIAKIIGGKYGMRQYQKIESGKYPKFKQSVVVAIDKILKTSFLNKVYLQYEQNVPRETEKQKDHLNDPLPLGNLVVTLRDYVDLLKQHVDIYRQLYLTNSGTIIKNQEIGGGIVQELLERDVLREAKGNPKKAKELLEAIRLKISETSAITLTKYIHDGEGIARK